MSNPQSAAAPSLRGRLGLVLGYSIEAVGLALIVGAPWAFGAVEPFDFFVYTGIGLMLLLWSLRILVEWQFRWRRCPLALGIAALFLLGAWQIMPLPPGLVAWLSPAGAKLTQGLLPRTPETLPSGFELAETKTPAHTVLSLYPAGTRNLLVEILAVFLFYAVVRNNCASPAALRRLSLTALVNGTALGMLGLLQFATSDLQKLYWHIRSPHFGMVFGPFLCRNHFPFYLNMCIGLGLGLVFSLRARALVYSTGIPTSRRSRAQAGTQGDLAPPDARPLMLGWSWSAILHDSRVLWLCFPLTLMVASVVCSLSRGGLLSLIGGSIIGLTLGLPRHRRWTGLVLVLVLGGGVALLLSWFGFDLLESRHGSILKGDVFEDRLRIWRALWPLAPQYPLTGTGYGTVEFVEPLNRPPGGDDFLLHTNAHNEYLEALVEGGWPRLLVTLALVGMIYWLGMKALARYRGRPMQGLIMGALIALTTLVLQCAGDFGIHIPAVMLLCAAIAAQVSAAALDPASPRGRLEPSEPANDFTLRLFGTAPALAAGVLVALALALGSEAWRRDLVYRHRVAANRAALRADELLRQNVIQPVTLIPMEMEAKLNELRAAVRIAPESAILHLQVADALQLRMRSMEQEMQREALLREVSLSVLAGAVGANLPLVGGESIDLQVFAGPAAAAVGRDGLATRVEEKAKAWSGERLRHLVEARDLAPILPQTHLRIAESVLSFKATEPRAAYLARAKRLRPFDPNLWFDCGTQEWIDGQYDEAVRSWRRCLELKDPSDLDAEAMFVAILAQARHKPPAPSVGAITLQGSEPQEVLYTPEQILARIVPSHPKLILAAVNRLLPGEENKARRQPYLEKAQALQTAPKSADEFHTRALLAISLERLDEAEKALSRALLLAPKRRDWRTELGKLYFDMKRYADSITQFELLLVDQPNDEPVKKLLDTAREYKKAADARDLPKSN